MRPITELTQALNRRSVLKIAAGTAAAGLLGAQPAQAAPGAPLVPSSRLGLQLFTVRDLIGSVGFASVFEALGHMGYGEVEFAGYTQGGGAISLAQIQRLMHDNGLRGIGSHVGYFSNNPNDTTFATNLTRVLDEAEALGLPHIGTANSPDRYGNTVDAWKRAAAEFNAFGAAAAARGMKFYQHNHADEFRFATDRPDVRLYDVLLAETDPDVVFLEMDIFWAFVGQFRFSVRPDGVPAPFEPLDYVLRAPQRYPLFHVKDGAHDTTVSDGYHMTDVGDGDIDYETFIRGVQRAHGRHITHHWQVERDDAVDPAINPAGSLSTASRSLAFLRSAKNGGKGHDKH